MLSLRTLSISLGLILTLCTLAYGQNCPAGEPPCKNQTPLVGHGRADALPAEFNCNCAGDNRRVVTVRIDSSWNVTDSSGTHTNDNIWNAVQCAINQWNTVRDPTGFRSAYYLVIDQSARVSQPADITVVNQTPTSGAGFAQTTTSYPYQMRLAPANGNLNGGQFTTTDLCGRVAHELGHKLGITDAGCASIMNGSNADGTRPHNTVTANDVYQVNRNFDPTTRTNGYCTAPGTDNNEESTGGDGGGDPCGGDPCCGDPCCGDPCCGDPCCYDSCCGDPCCGDPNCGQQCYTVCTTYCYSACTVYDDYGYCYYWEEVCETSCETQCY